MSFLAMMISTAGKHHITSSSSKNVRVSKIFANAFSTTISTSRRTVGINTSNPNNGATSIILLNHNDNLKKHNVKSFQFSTDAAVSASESSSTALKATVEEELDSALDDILGQAFQEAGDKTETRVRPRAIETVINSDDDDDDDDDVRNFDFI